MNEIENCFEYESPSQDITGSREHNRKKIKVSFGKYEILVLLNSKNEFVRILEISVDKDFRSIEQKLDSVGYHDVADLYE